MANIPSFVKFSRGLISAYERLSVKDPNTLYLVYESTDALEGKLYLGNKLISSATGGAGVTSLADLTDVNLSGELTDGMILQYNASTGGGIWEAVPISDVIPGGGSGSNDISIENALEDITNPTEKEIAIVGQNVYIYHNDEWVQLSDESLLDRVSDLETAFQNVYTKTEVNSLISNANHLKYQIVSDITDIDLTQDNDNIVFLVPKGTIGSNDGYDEYLVINDTLEKIGDWGIDASGITITASQVSDLNQAIAANQFIKSVDTGTLSVDANGKLSLVSIPTNLIDLSAYVLKTEIGDLDTLLGGRASANSTIVDELNVIKANLRWNEME